MHHESRVLSVEASSRWSPGSDGNYCSTTLMVEDQDDDDVPPPYEEKDLPQEIWQLVQLACPVVLTSILEYLPDIASIVLVGHINSPHATHYVDAAALAILFTNMTALFVGFGLSTALDTLCAQAHGAGKTMKLGIYLQTAMLALGIFTVPIYLVNWFSGDILGAMGQNAEIARLAGEYTRIMINGIPFLWFYEMNRKVLQIQNITTPPVLIAVLGMGVTVVAGYLLTFKTRLSFHGAALGYILGNFVMALSFAPYYAYTKSYKSWWPGWNLNKAKKSLQSFLRLGIPGMMGMILDYWSYEIMGLMAGVLPGSVISLSAHAVLVQLTNVLYMMYSGIGIAGNIQVGTALGANKPLQARRMTQITLVLVFALSCVVVVLVVLLRNIIPRVFITDPVAIHRASECLLVACPYIIVSGVDCAMQGVFRGIGKQRFAMVANFVALYIVGLPLGALLAFQINLNLQGLWIGLETGSLVFVISCSVYLARSSWKKLAQEAQDRIGE